MSIYMTTPTIVQLIMGSTAVAHTAFRNSIGSLRRMFLVTIHTSNLRLVEPPSGIDCFGLLGMTENAMFVTQRSDSLRCSGLSSGRGLCRRWFHASRGLAGKHTYQRT